VVPTQIEEVVEWRWTGIVWLRENEVQIRTKVVEVVQAPVEKRLKGGLQGSRGVVVILALVSEQPTFLAADRRPGQRTTVRHEFPLCTSPKSTAWWPLIFELINSILTSKQSSQLSAGLSR
jgi:hypothetical protein